MTIDRKGLVKLSPEERIKKLKQLGEQRKKEVDEIGRLIKESEQELRTDRLADDIAPEQRAVDISSLFEAGGEKLEKTVGNERFIGKGGGADYRIFAQAYQDYSSLKKMAGYAATGKLTEGHLEVIDKIGERIDRTKYESLSSEVANILVASRAVLYKIRRYAGLE